MEMKTYYITNYIIISYQKEITKNSLYLCDLVKELTQRSSCLAGFYNFSPLYFFIFDIF